MSDSESQPRFEITVPVRFRDLDAMGHVNNALYFTYLEEARTRYWLELRGAESYAALDFVVAHAACDYVSALVLGETVRVTVGLTRIGSRSFDLEYELLELDTARIVARGRTVQVMIDAETGKPRAIEPGLREEMRAFARRWGTEPEA